MLFVAISNAELHAQFFLPEQCIAKYSDGELKIRWEPSSLAEWESSKLSGYSVEIIENGKSGIFPKEIVKPLPYKQWGEVMNQVSNFKNQFYEGSRNFLYPEEIIDENQTLNKSLPGESRASLDTFRLGFLLYSNTYDFELAKYSGLATSKKVKPGGTYTIKISVPGYPQILKTIKAEEFNPKLADLNGEWGDHIVKLKWNTYVNKSNYFGYFVEKSENGINFTSLDQIPYVNSVDKHAQNSKSAFAFYETNDSLAQNYKTYYLRLRGLDYFGEKSKNYSLLVGYGFEELSISPNLYFADQTEDNQAHLKWNVEDDQKHLLKKFSVLRADSIKGKYEIAVDSIAAGLREFVFPIEHEINYFRIEAIPQNGKPTSSFPVLVMGQDTIAPAMPDIISAYIDTLDRAQVSWHANTETDLWGYRIYKANFKEDEFTLLNSYPTMDTLFIDTIDIDLGNTDIYYVIQAADKRNNRSPFSDTLKLEVPDVIPPFSPMISKVEQVNDSVKIYFTRSMSDDVVAHEIFRRDINEEKSWRLLYQIGIKDSMDFILDDRVEAGHYYAYTIIARDEVGLESKPEFFKDIQVKNIEKDFEPFKNIETIVDEKTKKVTIRWECNDPERLKTVLVYRGTDKDMMGKYKYIDAPEMVMIDDFKENGEKVYYRLKPVFKEQKKHLFSDIIEVQYDKNK